MLFSFLLDFGKPGPIPKRLGPTESMLGIAAIALIPILAISEAVIFKELCFLNLSLLSYDVKFCSYGDIALEKSCGFNYLSSLFEETNKF